MPRAVWVLTASLAVLALVSVAPADGRAGSSDLAARWSTSGQPGLVVAVVADRIPVAERPGRDPRGLLVVLVAVLAIGAATGLRERAVQRTASRVSLLTSAARCPRGPPSPS